MDHTEKFCKDKAIHNAIVDGISIIDGRDKNRTPDSIPKTILTDALAVSFDNAVGHDYIDDADSRFEFYHRVEERIPFDLDFFNRITKGGLPPKTLNIALAGTGVGKSLFMCVTCCRTAYLKVRMFCISLLRWQRNVSQKE